MSNLINLSFENQLVTTAIDDNGEIFFHATELATALGFGNPRQAIASHVDKEDVQKLDTLTKGGKQQINFVNESGMYALIFGSTKNEAKRFKRWVTSEVLPSIRKTGQYRHTISETQAHAISKAVKQKCQHNSHHYQTLYHALYDEFGITSYKELLASDFERVMAFIASFALASNNNAFWRAVGLLEYERMSHDLFQLQRRLDDICQAMHKFNRNYGLVYDALAEQQVVSTADTYASAKAFIANRHQLI